MDDLEITGSETGNLRCCIKEEIDDEEFEEEDDCNEDDCVIVDKEAMTRYMSGLISFEEYSKVLENEINEKLVVEVHDGGNTLTVSDTKMPCESEIEPTQKKVRKRRRKLNKALEGLMGTAYIKFAENDMKEAISTCMEVIRNVPNVPDPFQLLSLIYDSMAEKEYDYDTAKATALAEKSLQYCLISAHLMQTNSDVWLRAAEMCVRINKKTQALIYYEKACRLQPTSEKLWNDKCDLLKELNDPKGALECYRHILGIIPSDEGERYLKLAETVWKEYNKLNENDKALETMLNAFASHPNLVTPEYINQMLDLYFIKSAYEKSLLVLIQFAGVGLCYRDNTVLVANSDNFPDSLPNDIPMQVTLNEIVKFEIDLRAKLVICLIHLQYMDCIHDVIQPILCENPDIIGDLYLDIALAYMAKGHYSNARPLLDALVNSTNYACAAVWNYYGECLNSLHQLDEAVTAYNKVIELVPDNVKARLALSTLYQQLGKPEEALESVGPEDGDIRLWMTRCTLLFSQKKYLQYVECAKQVLFSFCEEILNPKHQNTITHNRVWRNRMVALRYVLTLDFVKEMKPICRNNIGTVITPDDIWDLYIRLSNLLIDLKMYDLFEKVSTVMLVCPQFIYDPSRSADADFICLTASVMNRSSGFAYTFIRDYCIRLIDSNRVWNILCQIIAMSQDIRHNRFCIRLALKHPENDALCLLNGHNALVAGSYKHALGEYFACLRQNPRDPLLHLMIGVTFIHLASQRFSARRHMLTIQACSFLNQYLELRGECQESYYNLGRAMHQLGLFFSAIDFYKKALTYKPAVDGQDNIFDLTREIAFNLNMIYMNSKSYELASQISQQYIII